MKLKPIHRPLVKLYSHAEYEAVPVPAMLREIRKRGVIAIGDDGRHETYLVSAHLWQPVNVDTGGILEVTHKGRFVAYGLPSHLWEASLLLTGCFTRAGLREFRKLPTESAGKAKAAKLKKPKSQRSKDEGEMI